MEVIPQFGINWPGRQEAIALADTPIDKPPKRCVEKDFGPIPKLGGNEVYSGDNLEVLKFLAQERPSSVQLIYIDPPYNTGKEFTYTDRHRPRPGDREAGPHAAQHAAWLSMMTPRLLKAKELLKPGGIIAISIDTTEFSNLDLLCQEIFGPRSHLGTLIWASNMKGRQIGGKGPARTHEYIALYTLDGGKPLPFTVDVQWAAENMPMVYRGIKYEIHEDAHGQYVTKNELYNTNSKFNEKTAPTMVYRIFVDPRTHEIRVGDMTKRAPKGFLTVDPHPNAKEGFKYHAWRWSREKLLRETHNIDIRVEGDRVRLWTKVRNFERVAMKDLIVGPSTITGKRDLALLGLDGVFDFPKPVELLKMLIETLTRPGDVVLDFFAGSGTTAQAVMEINAANNCEDKREGRSFILVQRREKVSLAGHEEFEDICDILRARVSAVADKNETNFTWWQL